MSLGYQGKHRLADDIFAQHRPERRAPVATPRKGRLARSLQLDVAPRSVAVDHLAEQDRPAVAKLRHEGAELVPGIGHGKRLGASGHTVSGEDLGTFALEHGDVGPEFLGERLVELDQPGLRDGRRLDARKELLRQPRIAVVEGKGFGISGR